MQLAIYCDNCNQLLHRAYVDGDAKLCSQCLTNNSNNDEYESVAVVESPLYDENVELLCEELIIMPRPL